MKTIWRNQTTNKVPECGLSYKGVVRRDSSGYKWSLVVQEEVVATGRGRTQLECSEGIRSAKAKHKGQAAPAPLAPTGKRGQRL